MQTSTKRTWVSVLVVIAAAAAPERSHATPYAYARDIVTMQFGGAAVFDHQTSLSFNAARMTDFGLDRHRDPRNALQAKVGAGASAGEDDFGQHGKGNYARADGALSGIGIFDIAGSNVAEASRARPGRGEGVADLSLQFGLTQTTEDPISIRFAVNPRMVVDTDGRGERSAARIGFSITFLDRLTGLKVFSWSPTGQDGDFEILAGGPSVSNLLDPFSLNTEISCVFVLCSKSYDKVGAFRADLQFAMGSSFDVAVHWLEEARVVDLRTVAAVPEPPTFVLSIGPLFALVWARRRGWSADSSKARVRRPRGAG